MKLRSPTTVFLNRARLIFTLTALVPTVCITIIGIVLVATGSKSAAVVGGILVLALCATALAGYGLGTLFVTRGAISGSDTVGPEARHTARRPRRLR